MDSAVLEHQQPKPKPTTRYLARILDEIVVYSTLYQQTQPTLAPPPLTSSDHHAVNSQNNGPIDPASKDTIMADRFPSLEEFDSGGELAPGQLYPLW